MENLRNNRFCGSQILSVTLYNRLENDKQQEIPVKLALSSTECEVFSDDWSKCLHSFSMADSSLELDSNGLIRMSYVRNSQKEEEPQNTELTIKFNRFDLIRASFDQAKQRAKKEEPPLPIQEIPFDDIITFACETEDQEAITTFKQHLQTHARKRVLFLNASSEISPSLLVSIALEFRVRFPSIQPQNWPQAFDILWLEFVVFCISLWTQSLKKVLEPHTGKNAFEYYRRLVASISALIAKGADVFQVDRREFLIAVRKYLDTQDSTDILSAAKRIIIDVDLSLNLLKRRWLLQFNNIFEFTQYFSTAICIAQSTSSDDEESDELKKMSNTLASWIMSIIRNSHQGPRISDFKIILENLAVSVLKETNTNMYEPEFHCTFTLWELLALVKAMH